MPAEAIICYLFKLFFTKYCIKMLKQIYPLQNENVIDICWFRSQNRVQII